MTHWLFIIALNLSCLICVNFFFNTHSTIYNIRVSPFHYRRFNSISKSVNVSHLIETHIYNDLIRLRQMMEWMESFMQCKIPFYSSSTTAKKMTYLKITRTSQPHRRKENKNFQVKCIGCYLWAPANIWKQPNLLIAYKVAEGKSVKSFGKDW